MLNGVQLRSASDRRIKVHLLTDQFEFHLENRRNIVAFDEHRVNHLVEMLERSDDRFSDSFQHDLIDIVLVGFPDRGFLVNIDLGLHFTDMLLDIRAIFTDILGLLSENTSLLSVVVLDGHGTVLAFEHFLVDIVETGLDLGDRILHDLHHVESGNHVFLGNFDEFFDLIIGLPLDRVQSGFQSSVHFLNTVLDQRFFYRVQAGDDFIITASQ